MRDLEVEKPKQTKSNGRLPVLKGSLKRGINQYYPFLYKQRSDAGKVIVLLRVEIIYVVFYILKAHDRCSAYFED